MIFFISADFRGFQLYFKSLKILRILYVIFDHFNNYEKKFQVQSLCKLLEKSSQVCIDGIALNLAQLHFCTNTDNVQDNTELEKK